MKARAKAATAALSRSQPRLSDALKPMRTTMMMTMTMIGHDGDYDGCGDLLLMLAVKMTLTHWCFGP